MTSCLYRYVCCCKFISHTVILKYGAYKCVQHCQLGIIEIFDLAVPISSIFHPVAEPVIEASIVHTRWGRLHVTHAPPIFPRHIDDENAAQCHFYLSPLVIINFLYHLGHSTSNSVVHLSPISVVFGFSVISNSLLVSLLDKDIERCLLKPSYDI